MGWPLLNLISKKQDEFFIEGDTNEEKIDIDYIDHRCWHRISYQNTGNKYVKNEQGSKYTYMNYLYGYGIILYVENGNKETRVNTEQEETYEIVFGWVQSIEHEWAAGGKR